MNKIIEKLYVSASEDGAFNAKKTEPTYSRVYNTAVAGIPSAQKKNEFLDMLVDYSIAVEQDAFEVGFKMAMELFAGGNLS